jgi:hypothetical protein
MNLKEMLNKLDKCKLIDSIDKNEVYLDCTDGIGIILKVTYTIRVGSTFQAILYISEAKTNITLYTWGCDGDDNQELLKWFAKKDSLVYKIKSAKRESIEKGFNQWFKK